MTDKNKLCKGNLMKEGIIMWAVFTKEGKAALRMDYEVHPENGKVDYGRLLSPDVPVLHEILMPDDTSGFLSLPEYGVSVRIRLRLRYPETEDSAVKHSEYEPKTCFPAWIMPHGNGQVGLYLQEPSTGQCFIPDMAGLPGLPEVKPESHPVKLEMLIRRAHCIFDRVNPAFLKISTPSGGGEAIWGHRFGIGRTAKEFENGLQAYTPFWGRINDGDNSLMDKFHNYIKPATEEEPGCVITASGSSKGWNALARHTVHDHKSLFQRIVGYIRNMNKIRMTLFLTGMIILPTVATAQSIQIDELECKSLKIGYEKTLHMIFPTPVKYLNMGNGNIIGEIIPACPTVIRLKATVRDFRGETNLAVVTEDSKYYSYCISFNEAAKAVYREGNSLPETAILPVSDEKLTHVIYPDKIVYVDFGSTAIQVEKAENVDNIIALKAGGPFNVQTNLTAITEPGGFYTFDLQYAPKCERFSFIVDKGMQKKQVAILDDRERNTQQKAALEKEISQKPRLLTNISDEVAGMRFSLCNIFVDNDILLFRFDLYNRSQIGYTIDFIRFYIQDAKKRKKTAVQQIEQQQLFAFHQPDEVPALSSRDFTVALPKFTIPDKKVLIIEIQEKNGGRHFYYKLKNKQLITAEILFPEILGH